MRTWVSLRICAAVARSAAKEVRSASTSLRGPT
jgi:hypothetical protein